MLWAGLAAVCDAMRVAADFTDFTWAPPYQPAMERSIPLRNKAIMVRRRSLPSA